MAGHGGFDHNAQSLRVVTRLEQRYPRFDGLNLTWETLEGLVKHNGPIAAADGDEEDVPFAIAEYARSQDLWLWSYAGAEAQAAAIADDIAYDAHDIDDGLRAGLLTLDGLAGIELVSRLLAGIQSDYPELKTERRSHELIRRLITAMIEDVIAESLRRLDRLSPASADDVRRAGAPVVGFSPAMAAADRDIKAFLTERLYRHRRVMGVMERAEGAVDRLFRRYLEDAAALPVEWRLPEADDERRTRRIADFLAGMTDRYALAEYDRLFGGKADLG
jgi:dGTPase